MKLFLIGTLLLITSNFTVEGKASEAATQKQKKMIATALLNWVDKIEVEQPFLPENTNPTEYTHYLMEKLEKSLQQCSQKIDLNKGGGHLLPCFFVHYIVQKNNKMRLTAKTTTDHLLPKGSAVNATIDKQDNTGWISQLSQLKDYGKTWAIESMQGQCESGEIKNTIIIFDNNFSNNLGDVSLLTIGVKVVARAICK